jgi:membrane-associated phospholipid phosphatase
MDSLQSLDIAVFRFINSDLSNSIFDRVLPFFSSNPFFVPSLILLGIWLVWKGDARGRLLVFFLLATLIVGDAIAVSSLKKFIGRPRPFWTLPEVHLLVGGTANPSMPSGHAANMFAGMLVAFVYYRRSLWFLLPITVLVALSRVYLGVHYPSDVLAGAFLGLCYATVVLLLSEKTWQSVGPRWFPIWWAELPSLLRPSDRSLQSDSLAVKPAASAPYAHSKFAHSVSLDHHWARLAFVLIAALLAGHLLYLAMGKIELSEDEAYQWLWSKHLAISYYSKPPFIAYTQFLGTKIGGDTEFGVRFFSPVLAAIGSLLLARFLAREVNGRVACLLVAVTLATPLLMVGAVLMTIDSLSVLFWVAAMITGWHAVQHNSTPAWILTGLWIGMGFLSKYVALLQWLCWAVYFWLWPQARQQLRRPGPYLALLVSLICMLPVLLWNAQHDWITVTHLSDRGGLNQVWRPTLRFFGDFVLAEASLLNPVFFAATIGAVAAVWKRPRGNPLLTYLFCMGVPLFIFYLLYTFRARVHPNWIAPAVLPLLCLMVVYWEGQWRNGLQLRFKWVMAGMVLGLLIVVPLHDTQLFKKMTGITLPPKQDPLSRVTGWKETARVVGQARAQLLAEGKPVFIIGDHYGITSQVTFYLPEAKHGVPHNPLAYFRSSEKPENQFYFWPGYKSRVGENAIYMRRVRHPEGAPASLLSEFASVTDLGVHDIRHKNRVIRQIQLFACRDLR